MLADVRRIVAAGADAALIGESLMRAPDPGALLKSFLAAARDASVNVSETFGYAFREWTKGIPTRSSLVRLIRNNGLICFLPLKLIALSRTRIQTLIQLGHILPKRNDLPRKADHSHRRQDNDFGAGT